MRKDIAAVVVLLLAVGLCEAKVSPSDMVSPKKVMKVILVDQVVGQDNAVLTAVQKVKSDENETGDAVITPPPLPEDENDTDEVKTIKIEAEVQQVRRVQWMLARQKLKETGYNGPVSELAVAFNNMTRHLKADFRESIINGTDEGLTRNVAYAVANRELARLRQENLDEVNVSDDAEEVIVGLAEAGRGQLIRNRIRSMDPEFKRKLAYIAVNGTSQEKQKLRERLNDYAGQENRARGMRLYVKIVANRLNHTLIRMMLAGDSGLKEIIDS
jgi:hypothetical protein